MKIAVVGNGIITRDLAPFDDPEWITWGLSLREYEFRKEYGASRPYDLLWECHDYEWDDDYKEFMKLNKSHYPTKEAYQLMAGNEGFKSSLAYMIIAAITFKPSEIGLFGFDVCAMKTEEYLDQIANIKYFVGMAVGRGIKVTCPEISKFFETETYGDKENAL